MMELYIHIPFCLQKCRYCDFASYAGMQAYMDSYIDDLLMECDQQLDALGDTYIKTVYIGGGTPSILPDNLFDKLLNGISRRFHFLAQCEWTVEANPGTLTQEWLSIAASYGVNRLSMGMQAAQPELLKTLGRIHSFSDVEHSVSLAKSCGFQNISLDLMFGLPGQNLSMWTESLQAALSLSPSHLSCYGLIPENGTALKADLDAGRLFLPEEEAEREMYDTALQILQNAGFIQYEISNFALHGCPCYHNIGYWRQEYYLGLGASAASMLPSPETAYIRKTNPSLLHDYHCMVRNGITTECQSISRNEAMFESLMLGLRMTDGVHEDAFFAMHGISLDAYRGNALRREIKKGLLVYENGAYRLTRRGMDIQNSILVDLMDP